MRLQFLILFCFPDINFTTGQVAVVKNYLQSRFNNITNGELSVLAQVITDLKSITINSNMYATANLSNIKIVGLNGSIVESLSFDKTTFNLTGQVRTPHLEITGNHSFVGRLLMPIQSAGTFILDIRNAEIEFSSLLKLVNRNNSEFFNATSTSINSISADDVNLKIKSQAPEDQSTDNLYGILINRAIKSSAPLTSVSLMETTTPSGNLPIIIVSHLSALWEQLLNYYLSNVPAYYFILPA